MSALPQGPSGASQSNANGDSTVVPTSQQHTETITISGAATTRTVYVAATGLTHGAIVKLMFWFVGASDGLTLVIRNANGTQLTSFEKSGGEANALFRLECTGNGGLRAIEASIPAL